MSYQVLARKWRPRTFQQLVGQESVVQALANALDNDRVHHAFLFTGTRGVGKTTVARILAKCLNCETGVSSRPCGSCSACVSIDEGRYPDMLEIDAASRTKVDDTRELLETVQFAPTFGRFKVYVIDEVHMLSKHSFNALLKTLEEPPPHVKFVLATTDPQDMPVTVLSRCLRFSLRRILPEQIAAYLDTILKEEGISAEPGAVERIARAADGSMRDALSLLDQSIAYCGGALNESGVARMMGSVDHEHIFRLIEALADGKAEPLLEIVRELHSQARKLDDLLTTLAEVLHRIALVQLAPGYRDPERSDWEGIQQLAERLTAEDVQLWYQIAIQGRADLELAPDHRTGLEMSLLRMLAFRPASAGQAPAAAPVAADSSAEGSRRSAAAPGRRTHSKEGQALAAPDDAESWHRLLPQLGLKGPIQELARNLQLESRRDMQLQFRIPDAVSSLGVPALVARLQAELSDRLGQEIRVSIAVVKEPVHSPAAASENMRLHQRSEAERAIESDPTVRMLQEKFGARLLPDSIKPVQ